MELQDLKPLEPGVPVHDVLRTTAPFDDLPYAPFWTLVAIGVVDLIAWALIIGVGYTVVTFVAGWM